MRINVRDAYAKKNLVVSVRLYVKERLGQKKNKK